jgi:NAD-dependent SIR2 family protein deacetylase
MLRCQICGGQAHAGLAHLHGNPDRPLCITCTKKVIRNREREEENAKIVEEFERLFPQLAELDAA